MPTLIVTQSMSALGVLILAYMVVYVIWRKI